MKFSQSSRSTGEGAAESASGLVPALDRSLDMLEMLSREASGLTLSELSTRLDIPKNAVFRITQTLLARGYLRRDERLAFHLTQQLLRLAPPRWGSVSLPEMARAAMVALRDLSCETVQLGVLSGTEGIIIDQVESQQPLRIVVDLGLRFPLHNNAPGKLLLAHLPGRQRAELLPRLRLTPSTARTITDPAALLTECERIVARGYSLDHAEADEGIHCVAAPVFDGPGVVGTLWVSGPAKRMPKSRFKELGEQVRAAGDEISSRIASAG